MDRRDELIAQLTKTVAVTAGRIALASMVCLQSVWLANWPDWRGGAASVVTFLWFFYGVIRPVDKACDRIHDELELTHHKLHSNV